MAIQNLKNSFLNTMRWEGRNSLSVNKHDPGNWTGGAVGKGYLYGSKFGVSAPVLIEKYPGVAMADVTEDMAAAIFKSGYWDAVRGDTLHEGVDHCVSDDAYNAGVGAALKRWKKGGFLFSSDPITTIHKYSEMRLTFLESLISWKIFNRGWAARVAGVEIESISMAHEAIKNCPVTLADTSISTSDHLMNTANQIVQNAHKTNLIASAITGGALVAAGAAAAHPDMHAPLIGAAAITAGAVHTVVKAAWNSHTAKVRSNAMKKAATIST